MNLNMTDIQQQYENAKGWREAKKWAFAIGTLGLGSLYLWATTSIIKQGEIGLRRNGRGEMILLPPGRHSNFPWETYPTTPQSLAKKIIDLGPYKIISVETGYIAKTFNQGQLEILEAGQHLLQNASHIFDSFIPVKQETKKLHEISAYTSDNVGLTVHADVRYQIEQPQTAITQIDDIENSITEIAEISISQIVSHHTLADFAPVTNVGDNQHHGISDVIKELTSQITLQLKQLGIKLLNIGITSWSINDKALAHELAQGAVIQSQAQSKMLAAQREADVKKIATDAEAKARITLAKCDAEALQLKGAAIKSVADNIRDNEAAQRIFDRGQQIDLLANTNNPNIFFSVPQPALTTSPFNDVNSITASSSM